MRRRADARTKIRPFLVTDCDIFWPKNPTRCDLRTLDFEIFGHGFPIFLNQESGHFLDQEWHQFLNQELDIFLNQVSSNFCWGALITGGASSALKTATGMQKVTTQWAAENTSILTSLPQKCLKMTTSFPGQRSRHSRLGGDLGG